MVICKVTGWERSGFLHIGVVSKGRVSSTGATPSTFYIIILINNLLQIPYPPCNPILDTRISVCPFLTLRVPPLDSETWWTGELWPKTNILNWQN